MKDIGMRESLVMRAQARTVLERLIGLFGISGKHFKGSHSAQEGAQAMRQLREMAERTHYTADGIMIGTSGFERLRDDIEGVVEVGYRIMECIATEKPISESDLDLLSEILNREQGPIRYLGIDKFNRDPYRREEQSTRFEFASDLLAYMNLCVRHGREHEICEQCGALMVAGRGGKKFCSPECRKAAWSYDRQKDYYRNRRGSVVATPRQRSKTKPTPTLKSKKSKGAKTK